MQFFILNKWFSQQFFYFTFLVPFFFICYYTMNIDCVIFLFLIFIIGIIFLFFVISIDDKNKFFLLSLVYVMYLIYLIYNLLYLNLIFSISFFGSLYFLKTYNTRSLIGISKDNILVAFLADQIIIENHFKQEFKFFYYIRIYSFILLLLGIFLFNFFFIELLERDLLGSLFCLWCFYGFNLLIYAIVGTIIVWFCNPKNALPYLNTAALGAVALSSTGVIFLGLHANSTGILLGDPIPLKAVYAYQKAVKGYSFRTNEEGVTAFAHSLLTDKPKPIDSEGFVSLVKMKDDLSLSQERSIKKIVNDAISAPFTKK